MKCAICELGNSRTHGNVFRFPASLHELGLAGEWAHPSCLTVEHRRLLGQAKRKDISLEQLVADRQR